MQKFVTHKKRTRLLRVAGSLVVVFLLGGLALIGSPAAHASTAAPSQNSAISPASGSSPTPPPVADDSSTTATPSPSVAPVITAPSGGEFVTDGTVTVAGTSEARATIQIFLGTDSNEHPSCSTDANSKGAWSCPDLAMTAQGTAVSIRVEAIVKVGPPLSDSVTIAVLNPPTISTNDQGQAVSNGFVHGTAYPGATVSAQTTAGSSCVESAVADSNGNWACLLSSTPDGTHRITARQLAQRPFPQQWTHASGSVKLIFDTRAPSAPTITHPADGARVAHGTQATFAGRGESGASLTVWALTTSDSFPVCDTQVVSSRWSCTANAAIKDGTYTITAIQQDQAGNRSAQSPRVSLAFGAAPTPSPTHSPNQSHSPSATPESPWSAAPVIPGTPHSTPTPTPTTPKSESGPKFNMLQPPQRPLLTTPFTDAISPVSSHDTAAKWLRAISLSLLAFVLLIIPAFLLTRVVAKTGIAGLLARWRIFGRNNAKAEFDQAPQLAPSSPWFRGVITLLIATILVTLSAPVSGSDTYLRLAPAMLLAVVIVSGVALAIPLWMSRRHPEAAAHIHFPPYLLVLIAAASLISRLLQLQPAFLFGVIALVAVSSATPKIRGRIAAFQVIGLAALAGLGWLVIGVLPLPESYFWAFSAELVNSLVLAAIGSAAVILLPLGNLPGKAILRWSRGTWVGMVLAIDTFLFAILVPGQHSSQNLPGVIVFTVCIIGFAAGSVSIWLWQRYVAPALR